MRKQGNYFIAMYDKEDNYIRDFESIQECADYFNTSKACISVYLCELKKLKNEFLLYKIDATNDNLSKSLQERTR